jgi:hypothetical protein
MPFHSRDHQVVDVHADDEQLAVLASCVDAMLRGAMRETQGQQACVQLGVLGPGSLTQTLQGLVQLVHAVLVPISNEA